MTDADAWPSIENVLKAANDAIPWTKIKKQIPPQFRYRDIIEFCLDTKEKEGIVSQENSIKTALPCWRLTKQGSNIKYNHSLMQDNNRDTWRCIEDILRETDVLSTQEIWGKMPKRLQDMQTIKQILNTKRKQKAVEKIFLIHQMAIIMEIY